MWMWMWRGNNVDVRTSGLGSPSNLLNNVNDSLQSWINDKNKIVNSKFPETFRCIKSGPSEYGRTVLLKYLFLNDIKPDRLYITGPTGNQCNDLKYKNIVLIKNIKELFPPEKLSEDIKKLMKFDDVEGKAPVINEYFCRDRHSNCNMIYLKQNILSADRQIVRENCNLFIFLEQRGRTTTAIYQDFFSRVELSYEDFTVICEKVWAEPHSFGVETPPLFLEEYVDLDSDERIQ